MRTQIILLKGKAHQVFRELAQLTERRGNETLEQIKKSEQRQLDAEMEEAIGHEGGWIG